MFFVFFGVVGIDQDAVKVNDDTDIEQITKNVVHETLEGCRSIGETKRHDEPLKGTIASMESGLPFITFSNADKVISMSEIKGSIDTCFASSIEEVRDERKRIAVLLGDFVETSKIHTESERAILFADEEYRGTMRGAGVSDEANS